MDICVDWASSEYKIITDKITRIGFDESIISLEALKEKCTYTFRTGDGFRNGEVKSGIIKKIKSHSTRPHVLIILETLTEQITLKGLLFGTPEDLGVELTQIKEIR